MSSLSVSKFSEHDFSTYLWNWMAGRVEKCFFGRCRAAPPPPPAHDAAAADDDDLLLFLYLFVFIFLFLLLRAPFLPKPLVQKT
jgi:hypothetical protein